MIDRIQLSRLASYVRSMDIGNNKDPQALFDPLQQGFNIWCTPTDHPGGDWQKVTGTMIAAAFTKPCEFVGTAFWNIHKDVIELTTDAYALRDHLRKEYMDPAAIHNRDEDTAWCIAKIQWVFEQAGIPCPEIVIGEED